MLPLNLTANECRVLGCLMEKSITTPDQYPLSLNALTNACNQKSSREPVMALSQGTVQHTVRILEGRHLLRTEESFSRGTEKYAQRLCNTSFSELQLDSAQFAILCLLLLRGPQTPGELRSRSGRLHAFADNNEVAETLKGLVEYENDALVVQLPRTPGRKDHEFMHLLAGPVDIDAHAAAAIAATSERSVDGTAIVDDLEQRVAELEAEVEKLKQLLS